MRTLVVALLFVGLGLLNIGGCGGSGGGDECDFDFDAFLNGADFQTATSQWNCTDNFDQQFSIQAFEDGTGFSTSGVGIFTYQRTGCRMLVYQSAIGNATVSNLQGSIDSGVLTFFQTSSTPELDNLSSSCFLVVF